MKTKIFSLVILVMMSVTAFSQNPAPVENKPAETKPSVKFDLAGQASLGYAKVIGQSMLFITFGGPNIKIGIDKIAINVGMFPSLRYNVDYDEIINAADKTPISVILGTGVQVSYKHIVGGCLFYSVKNIWYAAPAIGYKFK